MTMLLEISIENFKSFSEKQTFNMYAVNQGNIKNSTAGTRLMITPAAMRM